MPSDYWSEDDLLELGIDPDRLARTYPCAVELTGHDGRRCWAAIDLMPLMEGSGDE